MEYRFKDIREELDLKQQEMADRINIKRSNYANIESEIANIKLNTLLKYCNEFKVTLDYVCRLTDKNDYKSCNKIREIDKSIMRDRLNTIESDNDKYAMDIAKDIGVSKSTYSDYKNINRNMLMQTLMLKKLASKYNYSMDWIIGRSDNKKIVK